MPTPSSASAGAGSTKPSAPTKGSVGPPKAASLRTSSLVKPASSNVLIAKVPAKAAASAGSKTPSVAGYEGRAGLTMAGDGSKNPLPMQHGPVGQAERAFSAISTFLSGVLAISASQFIGAPLKYVDPTFYENYMAWTKESFAVLMTTITQWWAPTLVRVSGDASMKGQLYRMDDGTLKCNFPHRLVLMANHQLYTDWLYLWWIAYTNKMHGRIYIIMKESIKQLPIFGWAAQFYNFIFLSRNWETDKFRFKRALSHLRNPDDPMWLLIFPEGTNLSAVTREKSAAWAKKSGVPDMKHQLLPRSTGLQFCLQELRSTTNWLYDCTIAYEGVPDGMYGQDIFTLKSSFFEGRPPKSVNLFWRRFRIADIPIHDDAAFARWLANRWREKDYILEYFNKFHHFPADGAAAALRAVQGSGAPNHAKFIATEVKAGGWEEFLGIFGPVTEAAGMLSSVDMTEPLKLDALLAHVAQQQQINIGGFGKKPLPATSQQAIDDALNAAQKSGRFPQPMIDRVRAKRPAGQAGSSSVPAAHQPPGLRQPPSSAKLPRKANSWDSDTPTVKTLDTNRGSAPAPMRYTGPATAAPRASPQKVPLANRELMITQPLSTLAIQTAAAKMNSAASRRPKPTAAAAPKATKKPSAAAGAAKKPLSLAQKGPNGKTPVRAS